MRWLWFVAPAAVALAALLLSLTLTPEEQRLRAALAHWMKHMAGPLRFADKTRTRALKRLSPAFEKVVALVGGGVNIGNAVLVPKQAYLSVRAASGSSGSQHATVVGRLAATAPKFLARPLPVYDGAPAENNGVRFSKDPAFMDEVLVEGLEAKAIGKWLTAELRETLMEAPAVWLHVEGKYFSVTQYGSLDADAIDELVGVADAFYAEHGYDPDESLLGDVETSEVQNDSSLAFRDGAKKTTKRARADKNAGGASTEALEPAGGRLRLSSAAVDVGLYALALGLTVLVLGNFAAFHPAALFNSPDVVTNEPWQGGWTTKGFGALVAVESLMVGLVVVQAYLMMSRGQSLGKLLFGSKVVNADGARPGFTKGVLLRQWIFALPPLVVAVVQAKPFSARNFFEQVPTTPVIAVTAVLVALGVTTALSGRALQDRLSGTRVVTTEPWHLVTLQLGTRTQTDLAVWRRLQVLGGLFVLFSGLSVAYLLGAKLLPF